MQIVSDRMCCRQATVRPARSLALTSAPNAVVIGVVHAIHSTSASSIDPVHQVWGSPPTPGEDDYSEADAGIGFEWHVS